MSSPEARMSDVDKSRRSLILGLAAVALVPPFVGACGGTGLRPLYGTSISGGNVADAMAGLDVSPIPGRVGQQIRNELIFHSTGGDYATEPTYKLEIAIRESVQSILVKIDGDANGRIYALAGDFKLVQIDNNEIVFEGAGYSQAPFQHFSSIYSNIRARRDAENRAARELAQTIRTRVATYLSAAA